MDFDSLSGSYFSYILFLGFLSWLANQFPVPSWLIYYVYHHYLPSSCVISCPIPWLNCQFIFLYRAWPTLSNMYPPWMFGETRFLTVTLSHHYYSYFYPNNSTFHCILDFNYQTVITMHYSLPNGFHRIMLLFFIQYMCTWRLWCNSRRFISYMGRWRWKIINWSCTINLKWSILIRVNRMKAFFVWRLISLCFKYIVVRILTNVLIQRKRMKLITFL